MILTILEDLQRILEETYQQRLPIQITPPEHAGEITVVLFPLLRTHKKNLQQIAQELKNIVFEKTSYFEDAILVKGFLNLQLNKKTWEAIINTPFAFPKIAQGERILIEFPSPNTNKPLHLGHLRNLFIGEAVSRILESVGYKVIRCNLFNDRGVHICKAIWAYMHQEQPPAMPPKKGDHYVGELYVAFEQQKKQTPNLEEAAKQLHQQWEQGAIQVMYLWNLLNSWVYQGFELTFQRLQIRFDKHYYESQVYLLGKQLVLEGLRKGVFYQEEDGSIWVDLTEEGLDKKLLLRSDGTSVYITQDLGVAQLKQDEFAPKRSIYVIGNEQDYHMKVLKACLKRLGKPYAETIYHLSYGMVDLPTGKMKSREGTVVDADDLLEEMYQNAKEITEAQGKLEKIPEEERVPLYEHIGQGALRFFLLKVDPHKRILFDPKKSIDFKGHTGPFIQYTHARICSLLRKANDIPEEANIPNTIRQESYLLLKALLWFPYEVVQAVNHYNPALVANALYQLAQRFNTFYQNVPVLSEEDEEKRAFRLILCQRVKEVLSKGLYLLGIHAPERM